MNKKEKIAQLQKEIVKSEPSIELVNEYVLAKFPELKHEYKNHPLQTTPKKQKEVSSHSKKELHKFLYFLIETNLQSSHDYMEDEKEGVLKWVKKQPLSELLNIFSQHISDKKTLKNIFNAKINFKEIAELDNIVTDC